MISTIQIEEYVFQSPDAEDLASLVNFLIDGLKERSRFAVAIQDYMNDGNLIIQIQMSNNFH